MREIELNLVRVNPNASEKRINAAVQELDNALNNIWTDWAKADYKNAELGIPSKEDILVSKTKEAQRFKENLGVDPEDPRSPARVLADAVLDPATYVNALLRKQRDLIMQQNMETLIRLESDHMDNHLFSKKNRPSTKK